MYQLFGDLVLDPPPPDRLEAIKELEPYLRDLESREKLVVDRDEIHRKVSSFRLDETQKWKEMAQEGCPKRVAEHIVTTTGSWEARLSHQMHVPSYTSLNIPNGETGDPTSPCPALIMANKFDPETHFIYDHFHRREESDFSPFKGYPDHIRELHEEHTAWIRATNQAKVEIIYGRYVEKWVTKNLEFSHLQLWGEYDRVWLHFEWRSPERKQLSKILLFALHPQRFLNLPSGLAEETATQDKLHSCACKLAGLPYIAN
ncbi:Ras association (RalGDS/AF-6) domain family protein [Penicillium canescens]|nr:Ras association (RalGDS/AF-6) domain family protein [Penicillium canescens]